MARVNNLTNFLNDVASAIKTKKGYQSSQKIQAANFDIEILSISTINNQQKTVSPSTSQQIIEPDVNYTGLERVTINAVTSSIDQNIVAGNIKSGVTILGIQGTVVEVNNETKTITENGTYTPTQGKTGFSEVTVNVDSIPDGIFIQDTIPAKETSQALWLEKVDKTDLRWSNLIPKLLTTGHGTTWQDVLNVITQEQLDLFNSCKYIILVYSNYYYFDYDYGYFYGCNSKPYIDGSDLVIPERIRIGCHSNEDISINIFGGNARYSKNKVGFSNFDVDLPNGTTHTSDIGLSEAGLHIDVDDTRYIVYTNKSNSWDKILDTSNADATANDIVSGKTAFVNNTKITGSMPNNGQVNITPGVADQSIPAGYTSGGTVSGDTNLVQANIRSGISIFGVEGNLEPDKPDQTKTANPSTSSQIIEPDVGYELASVTINPVTASIDSNIIAENIRENVTILGVTGTYEGSGSTINIYHQTTAPLTFQGIWIKSTDYTSTTVIEVATYTDIVANRINIIRGTNYSTVMFNSNVENGLQYKFGGVYITNNNGEVDYDTSIYYGNGTNWIDITPEPVPEIVPFATATDVQISALLNAHYTGKIDLSTIWNIGDTRVIHLDAMTAPVPGSNKAHAAQNMTFRIIGFNHDNLTTQIGNVTKAAVTIECKELLGNYGSGEYEYLSGSSDGSTYENPIYFDNAYRRTWLNNNFIDALPSTFKVLVKEVVKRNLQGHNNTASYVETNDKAFLLSYPEVFNSTYNYYRAGADLNDFEGTQYAYYNQHNSDAGRVKYVNSNGSASSTAYYYWLRSPSSYNSVHWCGVYSNGSINAYNCSSTYGLAPALAI